MAAKHGRRRWDTIGPAAAVMAPLLAASPTMADWQYTRWGMTPGEVMAASSGAAIDNADRGLDAEGETAKLTANYRGATMPFKAVFLFDAENRLKTVVLDPVAGGSCAATRSVLDRNYGAPEFDRQVELSRTARWHDFGNDNVVVFVDLGEGNCSIQYSKLPNTHNDGTL